MAGKEGESLNKAAEGQAQSLLRFAWGYVFEAPTGTLHFMDIRYRHLIRAYHIGFFKIEAVLTSSYAVLDFRQMKCL